MLKKLNWRWHEQQRTAAACGGTGTANCRTTASAVRSCATAKTAKPAMARRRPSRNPRSTCNGRARF